MTIPTMALATEKELLAVIEHYQQAANTRNVALFEKILALDDPQFTEFEDFLPDLIGRQGVCDILNWGKQHPEFKYEVQYTDRKAFLLSPSVGYATAYSRSKSDHHVGVARATFIMKKYEDQWKIIHAHWSEVPKPEPESQANGTMKSDAAP